jgi:hypothetical protein
LSSHVPAAVVVHPDQIQRVIPRHGPCRRVEVSATPARSDDGTSAQSTEPPQDRRHRGCDNAECNKCHQEWPHTLWGTERSRARSNGPQWECDTATKRNRHLTSLLAAVDRASGNRSRRRLGRVRGAVLGEPPLAHPTQPGPVHASWHARPEDERHGNQGRENAEDEQHMFTSAGTSRDARRLWQVWWSTSVRLCTSGDARPAPASCAVRHSTDTTRVVPSASTDVLWTGGAHGVKAGQNLRGRSAIVRARNTRRSP